MDGKDVGAANAGLSDVEIWGECLWLRDRFWVRWGFGGVVFAEERSSNEL